MYKVNQYKKNKAKRLGVTTFAIANLEERKLCGEQWNKDKYCCRNIGKANNFIPR